jgi:hypothetical protein
MTYVSRVTGRAAEDRIIQRLSGDRIGITVTAFGGTVIAVESDLGRVRSAFLLCLRPVAEGVEIVPVFGVHRGRLGWLDAVRVHLARWLYSGFVRKDVAFMDDMRFHPAAGGPSDPVLDEFLEYLSQLPEDAPEESGIARGGVR